MFFAHFTQSNMFRDPIPCENFWELPKNPDGAPWYQQAFLAAACFFETDADSLAALFQKLTKLIILNHKDVFNQIILIV